MTFHLGVNRDIPIDTRAHVPKASKLEFSKTFVSFMLGARALAQQEKKGNNKSKSTT